MCCCHVYSLSTVRVVEEEGWSWWERRNTARGGSTCAFVFPDCTCVHSYRLSCVSRACSVYGGNNLCVREYCHGWRCILLQFKISPCIFASQINWGENGSERGFQLDFRNLEWEEEEEEEEDEQVER